MQHIGNGTTTSSSTSNVFFLEWDTEFQHPLFQYVPLLIIMSYSSLKPEQYLLVEYDYHGDSREWYKVRMGRIV